MSRLLNPYTGLGGGKYAISHYFLSKKSQLKQ